MQRVWLWGCLGCLLSFAGAQTDADPREQVISFREPAQRVQQILQTLSTRTQAKLVASAEVKDEIVLIDAERLTLQQLMDGLALALDAEWQQQPDGSYRLHRTVSQAQRRRALENQTLIRRWREYAAPCTPTNLQNPLSEADARAALQRIRQTIQEAMDNPDKDTYEVVSVENFHRPVRTVNPAERLLDRILQQMDWNEFVQIPVAEQRIYSTRPSPYAKPFKKSLAALIQQFHQEIATLQRLGTDYDLATLRRLLKEAGEYLPEDYFPDFTALQRHGVSSLHLVVKRMTPRDLRITLSLHAETPQGRTHIVAVTNYFRARVESLNLPEPSEWRSKPIGWSERSRQMLFLLNWPDMPPSLDLLQSLSPARVEPLSLVATDILRAYAAARQQSLIALLPDRAVNPLRFRVMYRLNESTRIGEAERYLAQWEWIEGAILIAKPHTASYHWNRRFQRDGVERIVQQARRRGYVDWEDDFTLMQIAPDADSFGACHWWLHANGISVYHDHRLSEILQALPPLVRNRLLQGETIALSELPPSVIARLHHALYALDAGFASSSYTGSSPLLDVAACYPSGLPREMRLRLEQDVSLGVFTENWHGLWHNFMDYWRLEDELSIDPSEFEHSRIRAYYTRLQQNLRSGAVQHGREIDSSLIIFSPDSVRARITINLPKRYELVGKPARWNEPPDELKAELEEQRKQFGEEE